MTALEDRFERAQALSAAFDPLIDVCLLMGVHTSELESLLRVEFVKRAAITLSAGRHPEEKGPSHEQVGLAVGLNRGAVQNIRSKGKKRTEAGARMKKKALKLSKADRVVDLWKTDPRYLNNSGSPLALPLHSQSDGASFEELVDQSLPGKRHKNVLRDFRRRGLVELLPDEIVRLRRSARPLPTQLNSTSLAFIADQMRIVGTTLLQRISEAQKGLADPLAAFVRSEPIMVSEATLQTVQSVLNERLASLIKSVERDMSRAPKSKKARSAGRTIAANVYTYSIPAP